MSDAVFQTKEYLVVLSAHYQPKEIFYISKLTGIFMHAVLPLGYVSCPFPLAKMERTTTTALPANTC